MNKSLLLTIFLGAAAITGVLYSTQSSKSGNFLAEIKHMNEFKLFINDYQKQYSADEFVMRHSIFSETLDIIKKQNDLYDAGLSTYYLGVNQLADLTNQEIKKNYLGSMQNNETEIETETEAIGNNVNAPRSIDWVTLGKVNAVKNQGQCGSCYAFSAACSLESLHAIKNNKLESFSEQSIIDCSSNYGCKGGIIDRALGYVEQKGIPLESAYPYTHKDGTCKPYHSVFKNTGIKKVTKNDEQSLINAIALQPVSVAIDASQKCFQSYKGGILNDSACGIKMDHAVVAVGYGNGFYKIRNSWGPRWGDKGYINFARLGNGPGQCGLQQWASYPTL